MFSPTMPAAFALEQQNTHWLDRPERLRLTAWIALSRTRCCWTEGCCRAAWRLGS